MAALNDTLFMCIVAAHGPPEKSFEEVRIDDYIKAYSMTGRPPPPCPQEPASDLQRTQLSLPPLFKPYTEASLHGGKKSDIAPPTYSRPPNPSELPDAQGFFTSTVEGEIHQTISAMPRYNAFSHEELRYHAYAKGHKQPPTAVPAAPFVQAPAVLNVSMSMNNRPILSAPSSLVTTDTILNICAQPDFLGHSPEELRVAFIKAGRELNSHQIISTAATIPFASAAPFASPSGGALSPQPTLRLF